MKGRTSYVDMCMMNRSQVECYSNTASLPGNATSGNCRIAIRAADAAVSSSRGTGATTATAISKAHSTTSTAMTETTAADSSMTEAGVGDSISSSRRGRPEEAVAETSSSPPASKSGVDLGLELVRAASHGNMAIHLGIK